MSDVLLALGDFASSLEWSRTPQEQQSAIDRGIRASLLCGLFGVERERALWPYPAHAPDPDLQPLNTTQLLGGMFLPLDGVGLLCTLAGAADLDPMDPGPSHTVLPATMAACAARRASGTKGCTSADDANIAVGVLAGVEVGWRLRRAILGARPGLGFHSPGVFGTVAAAAAAARTLDLSAAQSANAVAIALTRAAGLALNSAASAIGMTHFGWGAFHGLEAALLAAHDWPASHDAQRALETLFGEGKVDTSRIAGDGAEAPAATSLVFKYYPCNIYTNLIAKMLRETGGGPLDRVRIHMPWIPHLDCGAPKDLRQARNSAQAVAAIAAAGDTSYAAFSGSPSPWRPAERVQTMLSRIELDMDRDLPTRLSETAITLCAWRGGQQVLEAKGSMRDLAPWGREHAQELMGADDPTGGIAALYDEPYLHGFKHLKTRWLALS